MLHKSIFLILTMSMSFSSFAQKGLPTQSSSSVVSYVENEAYIKFEFQKHVLKNKSDYNIAFFAAASSSESGENLEFWGHGNQVLSILGPIQMNLEKEEIIVFKNLIKDHYLDFNRNVRLKRKTNEHSDLLVFESGFFIFSAYMNNRKPEYAFWINKKKYLIDEKSLVILFTNIESYFGN
jgi:hypothetical protein